MKFSNIEKEILSIMLKTLKIPEDFNAIFLFKKLQKNSLGVILLGDVTPEEIGIIASLFEE